MALPLFLSLHITVAVLILSLTVGATAYNFFTSTPRSESTKTGLYEDRDGVATAETQKAYSVKLQNNFATLFTAAGFAVSLTNAVLATLNEEASTIDGWLQFSLWVSADNAYYCPNNGNISAKNATSATKQERILLMPMLGLDCNSTSSNSVLPRRCRTMLYTCSFRSRI
jgi:hypothetical protein